MKIDGDNEYAVDYLPKSSSAYISCVVDEKTYTYNFTGVTAIEHNMTLNLNNTSSQGSDIVNGARNQPNKVRLSVIETDVEHTPGWAAAMMNVLVQLKKRRLLCEVATSIITYDKMLLTEITANQNDENLDGWSGTIEFTEYIPSEEGSENNTRTNNNSSSRTNTGSAGATAVAGSVLLTLLQGSGQ